jgi:hypothetical protein
MSSADLQVSSTREGLSDFEDTSASADRHLFAELHAAESNFDSALQIIVLRRTAGIFQGELQLLSLRLIQPGGIKGKASTQFFHP